MTRSRNKKEDIFFTMGPISIHQFNEFANCGITALKIFQYIKTEQGLDDPDAVLQFKDWFIKLDTIFDPETKLVIVGHFVVTDSLSHIAPRSR